MMVVGFVKFVRLSDCECCIKGSEGITALEMTEVERLMKFCCMIRSKQEREVPGDRSGDVGL